MPTDSDVAKMVKGNLFILIATIFFGVNVPAIKVLEPDWLSWQQVTTVRFVCAAILVWVTSLCIKNDKIAKGDWWRIIVGGSVCLFPFIFLFCLSLNYGSVIDISIINTSPPIFVIALGALFFRHRVTWLEIAGIVISLVGAIIVVVSQSGASAHASHPVLGDLIALGSCLCYAFYLIITQGPSKRYHPITLTRWLMLFAAIPCLPFIPGILHSGMVAHPEPWPIGIIIFIVLGPTYLSYIMVPKAIKAIGSELVSMYQYLVPVFAVIAAVIMKVDALKWYQPVAFAVIIVGVIVTNLAKRRMAKQGKLLRD